MSGPSVWCEARCHYMLKMDRWKGNCHQTAPGRFGSNEAKAAAREAGWKAVRGEWCCPACQPEAMK